MKRILVSVFYRLSFFTGLTELFFFINRKKRLIVTFHNVIVDELFDDSLHLGVSHSRSNFQFQVNLISRRFTISDDIESQRCAIITFDDGYQNNLSIAAPVLEELGIKAYFFVPLDSIDSGAPFWVDKMTLWFSYVPFGTYTILNNEYTIETTGDRPGEFSKLYRELLNNYGLVDQAWRTMNELVPFEGLVKPDLYSQRCVPLSTAELSRMKESGHKIGAHSVSHNVLSKISLAELREDFKKTADALGSVYNTKVFAYPFGGRDETSNQVFECCREFGFSHGLLNVFEDVPEFEDVNYVVPRIALPNTSDRYLINARLSGLEQFIKGLLGWK